MTNGATLPWSPEQWAQIQDLIQQTARKIRVAASFLPLEGPLPPGQAYVRAHELDLQRSSRRQIQRSNVDEHRTLPLVTIMSPVYLKTVEVQDPELSSARQMFARAAGVLARLEDAIIFNGLSRQLAPGQRRDYRNRRLRVRPRIYEISGPGRQRFAGIFENRDSRNNAVLSTFPQRTVEAW